MKNTQSKIKPLKIGKQSGKRIVLDAKIIRKILDHKKKKLQKKYLEKNLTVLFVDQNQSRFLKQKIN